MKKINAFFISFAFTMLLALNLTVFPKIIHQPKINEIIVQRAIDGDTLVTTEGEILRLENINTPERNRPGYEEAKIFLSTFQNKTLKITTTGYDKYGRTLAKLYYPTYLNLEIVKRGLAKKYLVEQEDIVKFSEAEQEAIKNQRGLWKKSPYFDCLSSKINPFKETVVLINSCTSINNEEFILSDESRKEFKLPPLSKGKITVHSKNGDKTSTDFFLKSPNLWNNDRDTLYIFDSRNNLVHYHPYGYD